MVAIVLILHRIVGELVSFLSPHQAHNVKLAAQANTTSTSILSMFAIPGDPCDVSKRGV